MEYNRKARCPFRESVLRYLQNVINLYLRLNGKTMYGFNVLCRYIGNDIGYNQVQWLKST